MLKLIQMTVNDKPVELAVDERESLLDTLRNRLGLTSVKRGCEVGECGACTVLVDGEAIDSCIYLTVRLLHAGTHHDGGGDCRHRQKVQPRGAAQAHLRPPLPLHRLSEYPQRDGTDRQ